MSQSISPLGDLLFQFECLFRGEIRTMQEIVVILLFVLDVQFFLQGFGLPFPDLPSDGGHIPEGMVEKGVCFIETPADCDEDVFHCSVCFCVLLQPCRRESVFSSARSRAALDILGFIWLLPMGLSAGFRLAGCFVLSHLQTPKCL